MIDVSEPRGGLTAPHAAMLRLAYGAQAAQVVYVAAKLGLADLLGNGPLTATQLGEAIGLDAALLRRIMRSLVSLGVLAELAHDRFALTDMGVFLQSDRADSVQPRVVFNTEVLQPLWRELLHTLRTGESAAKRVLGMPFFDYLSVHPEVGALFDRVMESVASHRLGRAVAAYDFGQFGTIVDVGGGTGALLIEILRAYSQPRGIVFDLPSVAERARQHIAASGLTDRCTAVGGDALQTVPKGADGYVLANFVTGLDEEQAAVVLRGCRSAIAPGGKVLLIERLLPPSGRATDPHTYWDATTVDLTMLSIDGAGSSRVRTTDEIRMLLETAGFSLTRIVPTASLLSVIEASPMDLYTGSSGPSPSSSAGP